MRSKKYSGIAVKKFAILFVVSLFLSTSCRQAAKVEVSAHENPDVSTAETRKPDSVDAAVSSLMKKHNVPGVSVALVKNGKAVETRSYGIKQSGKTDKIDANTVFSVGSVSKVANALVVLKLVNDGKLDLDTDVNTYLKNWKIPSSEYTTGNPITLRHILSHTAGLSVHGFDDYYPGEEIPTPIQTLNGEKPAKSGKVESIFQPGTKFKYSGGGTTVSQQIVADVTGMSYEKATQKILFEPLGIGRASYEIRFQRASAISPRLITGAARPLRYREAIRRCRKWRLPDFGRLRGNF